MRKNNLKDNLLSHEMVTKDDEKKLDDIVRSITEKKGLKD